MKYLLFLFLLLAGCSMDEPFKPPTVANLSTVQDVIDYISAQKYAHCIEAATIAEIACGQIGLNTMRVNLYTADKLIGHQVLLAWNQTDCYHLFTGKSYGVNNGYVLAPYAYIPSTDWRQPVLGYFRGRYVIAEIDRIILNEEGK